MENYKQKVLNGLLWETSTKVLVQVFSWVSTIWVARLLSPEDYGIVLISGIFTGLLTVLAGFGISSGIVQKDKISSSEISSSFTTTLAFGFTVYAALYFAAPSIANIYANPELLKLLRVAGLIIVLSALNIVPHALMMRELKFKFAALVEMFSKIILISSTLLMAYGGMEYWSLVCSTLIAQTFVLLCYLFASKSQLKLSINVRDISEILDFGARIVLSRLLMWWNGNSAATVISYTFDKATTGHFQMAFTLATLPLTKIGEVFDKITFPAIAAIKGDKERAARVFLKMHKYLLLLTCPMFIGMAAVSEELVPLLLGEKWIPIIIPLQILCVGNIFRVTNQLVPRVLEGLGNANASVKFQFISAVLCPIAMIVGSIYDLNGLLVGWIITLPFVYMYLYSLAHGVMQISFKTYFSAIWPSLVSSSSIIIAIAVFNIFGNDLNLTMRLAFKVVIGGLAFIGTYILIQPGDITDLYRSLRKK